MADSLKFGTSGLRGLAADLVGPASTRYAAAFLSHLRTLGEFDAGDRVLIGRDLRDSSPAIAEAVIAGIAAMGGRPVDCGTLPTPALALAAIGERLAAIMVTGSHIPADRNGLKFYRASGEVTKADEAGIAESLESVGAASSSGIAAESSPAPHAAYLARYTALLGPHAFTGLKIGIFQHSSVARDDLVELLSACGAVAVPLGRAEHFVPIDTEAVGGDTAGQARRWVEGERLDALVSTDGDADRPLVVDETGALIRGDMLGVLAARFVGADAVVTPVTSNSAIEGLGWFARVVRTRVGSPFVIAGMEEARVSGSRLAVGFEANGGVLLGAAAEIDGRPLAALPTRDALLPIVGALALARRMGLTLSRLAATIPARIARSDRLEHVPAEASARLLRRLEEPAEAAAFFAPVGEVATVSAVDGLRFTFGSGDILHYRASGNAPELRCYAEAATAARADGLLAWGLAAAEKLVR